MTNPQPPDLFSADCERVQDALFSLADAEMNHEANRLSASELNEADRLFLEKHLLTCEACRMYRQDMQYMAQSLSGLEAVGVPAGLEDRIMANIAKLVGPDASSASNQAVTSVATLVAAPAQPRSSWKRYAPLAAAVMVVALALPFITQSFGPQSNPAGPQQVAQRPAGQTPAMPGSPTEHAALPQHNATSGPAELATVPAKGTTSKSATPNTNTTQATHTSASVQTATRPTITPAANQSPVDSTAAQPADTDVTQLASALPQSASQHFSDTYDSASESDVYYDPVSTLVGF